MSKKAYIVGIRSAANNKIQLHLTEEVQKPNQSALGIFNKSDERFSGNSLQHAWLTSEPEDAKGVFPDLADTIEEAKNSEQEVTVNNYLAHVPDYGDMHIRILESFEANDWEIQNLPRAAKYAPNSQQYLLKDGHVIFNRKDVVFSDDPKAVRHQLINHDQMVDSLKNAKVIYDGETMVIGKEDSAEEVLDEEQEKSSSVVQSV